MDADVIEKAGALWRQMKTSNEIADELWIDRGAVIKMSLKHRDLFPKRSDEERRALISKARRVIEPAGN